MPADKFAEVDINRPAKSVPTCEALFLLALQVPEGIADVLEIESNAVLFQPCPSAAPFSEEMPVSALAAAQAQKE